jgi:recombination protein RecA
MSAKVDAFFKSLAENDEKLSVQKADERLNQILPSISTGSYLLNDILGCNGYPFGRIIQLYGAPGSGKSLMTYLAIVEAQKVNPTAKQVLIDSENTFNAQWAEILGVDTSRLYVVDGELAVNGKRCFEMLLGEPKEDSKHNYSGKKKEGLLDLIANKEFDANLIILDSLGAIIPPGEDVAAVGKMNMALMARFLTTTFKKLSLDVTRANIPFLIVNHKRDNMDMYGADHTFSGGNTYAHFLSANIYFEAVMRKDSVILDEKDNKIGHIIRASIEKSKFSAYPKKCEFKVNFSKGIVDSHEEIAQLALDYDIVKKPSSVSHEYKDKTWVGFQKYCDGLKEDPELVQEILTKITEAQNKKRRKSIPSEKTNVEILTNTETLEVKDKKKGKKE